MKKIILFLVLLVLLPLTSAGIIISNEGGTNGGEFDSGTAYNISQTFNATNNFDLYLYSYQARGYGNNTNVTLEVRAVNSTGSPNSTIFYSQFFLYNYTNGTWVNFYFTTPTSLLEGVSYALVAMTDFVIPAYQTTTNNYPAGSRYIQTDGVNWAVDNNVDFNFRIGDSYFDESLIYPSSALELTYIKYDVNITTPPNFNITTASLVFNGTAYLALKTSDHYFTKTIQTPSVTSDSVKNLYWSYTATNTTGGEEYYNSSINTQTILKSDLYNCTVSGNAINFSIFDESDSSQLTADANTYLYWTLNSSSTQYKNRSYGLEGKNTYSFCVNSNGTFYTEISLRLEAEGYHNKIYTFQNLQLTNSSEEYSLYMLNDTAGKAIIFELKDEGLTPLQDYTITIYRKTPERILVAQDDTNIFGQIVAYLIENDVDYDIEIYDSSGELIKSILDTNIACKATICVIPLVAEVEINAFGRYSNIDDFACTISYNNNTRSFSYAWNDETGDTPTNTFYVKRVQFNNVTTICTNSSSSLTGSFTCGVGAGTYSYTAEAFRTVDGEITRMLCTNAERGVLTVKVDDLTDVFGLEGMLWGFILLFTIIIIGIYSPAAGFVIYIVGIIFLSVTQIVFINPIILTIQILIGVIAIWALRT